MARRFVSLYLLALLVGIAAGTAGAQQQPVTLRVVFPEGFSARQMVDRVAEVRRIAIRKRGVTPELSGASYKAALTHASVPRGFRAHLKRRSIEGFLFPSLYEFTPSTSASELVGAQIAAFERTWRTVDLRRARARNLTPIDATLRYGLGIQGTRPLTKAHLRSDSPYNTRRFQGLPPTPIGNPGLASIRAAAAPAAVDYLYYVRKPNSIRHFFTADEQEFCRKAREYGYRC